MSSSRIFKLVGAATVAAGTAIITYKTQQDIIKALAEKQKKKDEESERKQKSMARSLSTQNGELQSYKTRIEIADTFELDHKTFIRLLSSDYQWIKEEKYLNLLQSIRRSFTHLFSKDNLEIPLAFIHDCILHVGGELKEVHYQVLEALLKKNQSDQEKESKSDLGPEQLKMKLNAIFSDFKAMPASIFQCLTIGMTFDQAFNLSEDQRNLFLSIKKIQGNLDLAKRMPEHIEPSQARLLNQLIQQNNIDPAALVNIVFQLMNKEQADVFNTYHKHHLDRIVKIYVDGYDEDAEKKCSADDRLVSQNIVNTYMSFRKEAKPVYEGLQYDKDFRIKMFRQCLIESYASGDMGEDYHVGKQYSLISECLYVNYLKKNIHAVQDLMMTGKASEELLGDLRALEALMGRAVPIEHVAESSFDARSQLKI